MRMKDLQGLDLVVGCFHALPWNLFDVRGIYRRPLLENHGCDSSPVEKLPSKPVREIVV